MSLEPSPSRKELIVTTINPSNWGDIWNFSIKLKNEAGAVRSVIDTLVQHNVNILVYESLTEYANDDVSTHNLFVIADLGNYSNIYDGTTDTRNHVGKPNIRPNYLISEIISNSYDFIRMTEGSNRWGISAQRLNYFYSIKRDREKIVFNDFNLLSGKLRIPKTEIIDNFYDGVYAKTPACYITSDTEEKYINIRFLSDDRIYVLLEISHREEIGAISELMGIIASDQFAMNIESSYSRIFNMSEESIWYAMLELPLGFEKSDFARFLTAIDKSKYIKDYFSIRDTLNSPFDAEQVALGLNLENYRTSSTIRTEAKANERRENPPTSNQEVSTSFDTDAEYDSKLTNVVFAALPYRDKTSTMYSRFWKRMVEKHGIKCVAANELSVANPDGDEDIFRTIKRYIANCQFLIADVTHANANVFLELGYAMALKKPYILICDEDEFESLPFDIKAFDCLKYRSYDLGEFEKHLDSKVRAKLTGIDQIIS